MITKRLIAAAALLTLTSISGLAYAGTQPSDQRWWPRQTQPASASSEEALASVVRAVPQIIAPKNHQYRGGPRSIH
jgi:hypothetical protein